MDFLNFLSAIAEVKFRSGGNTKIFLKVVLSVIIIAVLTTAGWFIFGYFAKKKSSSLSIAPVNTSTSASQISLPASIIDNKFGFLSGGPEDADFIKSVGAGWVRPHPGPFLWDAMQKNGDSSIDFSNTDAAVKNYQKKDVAILATLWPFADWEQGGNASCKVSNQDEFLPKNDFKNRRDYLPEYRCNPSNWQLYQKWVKAVVERYDGDGQDDMKDLTMPVKFWEVMNEPDLSAGPQLDFYKEKNAPKAYSELLIKTSEAIRSVDNGVKILIAGAAGGSDQFLSFYREVFSIKQTYDAFDIANIHCISNDNYQSFNVEPYKKMLKEFGLDSKPIWVTEAQAIVSSDQDINATQTLKSTQKALELGAERLFYTQYSFETSSNMRPPQGAVSIKIEISGSDPQKAYQEIIKQTQ